MKRVVIVGGGFAGAYIARNLENKYDVVLIDTKDYFEFTPSVLRAIINPAHMKKIQVLHKDYLKKAQVIVGRATKISAKEVVVGGVAVHFNYLIIATGSRYRDIFKEADIILPNRAKELAEKGPPKPLTEEELLAIQMKERRGDVDKRTGEEEGWSELDREFEYWNEEYG